jgi:hypothetical protein
MELIKNNELNYTPTLRMTAAGDFAEAARRDFTSSKPQKCPRQLTNIDSLPFPQNFGWSTQSFESP